MLEAAERAAPHLNLSDSTESFFDCAADNDDDDDETAASSSGEEEDEEEEEAVAASGAASAKWALLDRTQKMCQFLRATASNDDVATRAKIIVYNGKRADVFLAIKMFEGAKNKQKKWIVDFFVLF